MELAGRLEFDRLADQLFAVRAATALFADMGRILHERQERVEVFFQRFFELTKSF